VARRTATPHPCRGWSTRRRRGRRRRVPRVRRGEGGGHAPANPPQHPEGDQTRAHQEVSTVASFLLMLRVVERPRAVGADRFGPLGVRGGLPLGRAGAVEGGSARSTPGAELPQPWPQVRTRGGRCQDHEHCCLGRPEIRPSRGRAAGSR